MAAVVASTGLVNASPVPVAARLMAVDTGEGLNAGREEVPVAVVRGPDRLEEGLRAPEGMGLDAVAIDLPPMAKTPVSTSPWPSPIPPAWSSWRSSRPTPNTRS